MDYIKKSKMKKVSDFYSELKKNEGKKIADRFLEFLSYIEDGKSVLHCSYKEDFLNDVLTEVKRKL